MVSDDLQQEGTGCRKGSGQGGDCVCVSVENTNTRYKFCQVLFECLVTAE